MATKLKLTKLQRYTAYCILLVEIKKAPIDRISFCILAIDALDIDIYDWIEGNMKENFPEINKRRPPGERKTYWFPETKKGREQRIEILEQCIAETHPVEK